MNKARKKRGVWWGAQDAKPVVGLHGLLDSGSTFDNLVPLLQVPAFLSLELPGHGLSSHLPPGVVFHFMDFVVWLRYVLKNHYKWDDLTVLGHSYGAAVWQYYVGLFPEQIKRFISIDTALYMILATPEKTMDSTRFVFDQTLEIERRLQEEKNEYDSYEDMLNRMYTGRKSRLPISREACQVILRRGSLKTEAGKYCLTRDLRINSRTTGTLTYDYVLALAERVNSEVLYLVCSGGFIKGPVMEKCMGVVRIMEKSAKRLQFDTIQGDHHVHLEQPEKVATVVNEFLNN